MSNFSLQRTIQTIDEYLLHSRTKNLSGTNAETTICYIVYHDGAICRYDAFTPIWITEKTKIKNICQSTSNIISAFEISFIQKALMFIECLSQHTVESFDMNGLIVTYNYTNKTNAKINDIYQFIMQCDSRVSCMMQIIQEEEDFADITKDISSNVINIDDDTESYVSPSIGYCDPDFILQEIKPSLTV